MASQVPYNPEPTVSPQLAPTPAGHVMPPPGAFGGLTAAATEHLGQAISQSGNELFERANAMQMLNQQAAADEAASNFQMKSAQQHADFLNLQGKSASDSLQPMLDSVEQSRKQIRESLTSPYAQMQYDRDTRRMQGQLMMSSASHAAQQNKAYVTGSLKARSDTADNAALSLPQDDAGFQASLNDKDKIADQMQAQNGWSQEQRDSWATRAKSTLTSNRLEGIAKTDPFTADRLAQQAIADKTLVGQDIANVTGKVYTAQNTIGARQIANKLLSGEGSVAGGGPVPISTAATTIGQYLSKDNYDLIGRTHDGADQALGRYGVPAKNLSPMLKDAGMSDMSAADFLKSHQAQDQLFSATFGKLQDDTGSFNDALKKWTGAEVTPHTTPGDGSNVGTAEQKQAFSFFRSSGWSSDSAHAMVATLSGESGPHLNPMANQHAGGRNWESRFEASDASNGVANWDNARAGSLESWARGQGLNPNDRMTQLKFVDYEARQMGFNPAETGNPRALTVKLTGSTESGQGYEKPARNNGGERWDRYSGQRYSNDPTVQQTNGLIARNTPLSDLQDRGKETAANLAPNNPLFSVYLQDRLNGEYRQQEFQQKQAEDKNRWVVEGALNTPDQNGRVPTTVDELRQDSNVAQAFDNSSPREQNRVQAVLASNLVAGGIKFTPDTFKQYNTLHTAAIDPAATPQQRQELLDTNISGLDIPLKARQQLFKDQQAVSKAEETSPQMGRALRVLGPTLNAIGLDKKDPDNYNSFISQLHDAIQEHNRDFTQPLRDDDIKAIGTQLLRDQPQSGFWSHFSSAPKWYQLQTPAEYSDKVRADPRWEKVGVDPTDEMIHTMWVQQQFKQFYSKQQGPK